MRPSLRDIVQSIQNQPAKDQLIQDADAMIQIDTEHMTMVGYTMFSVGLVLKQIFEKHGDRAADKALWTLQQHNKIAVTRVLPKKIVEERYDLASNFDEFARWVINHDPIIGVEVVPLSYLWGQRLLLLVKYNIIIPEDFANVKI